MQGELIDQINENKEEMRLYQQEWLILEVTELIASLMDEKGVKKTELAERLDRTKGYITQLLDGRANMTLKTISDVMLALDSSLEICSRPLGFASKFEPTEEYEHALTNKSWTHLRLRIYRQEVEETKISCGRLRNTG